MLISDAGVLISAFADEEWEKAGATYADMLILSVGKLPPPLRDSGIVIDKELSNLRILIPHKSDHCFDKDGAKIPGKCGHPKAEVKNLTLY